MRLIYLTGILDDLQYNFRFHTIRINYTSRFDVYLIGKELENGTHTKFHALFSISLDGDKEFTYYQNSYTFQSRILFSNDSLSFGIFLCFSLKPLSSVFCIANNLTSHSHGCSLDVLSETQNSKCSKNLQKKRKRKLALSANNRDNVNAQYLYSRAAFIRTKF